MASANGFWGTSAATTGDYIDWMQTTTGTLQTTCGYYTPQPQTTYTPTTYTPIPFDPEAVRRQKLQERRREPLERWREVTRNQIRERQKKEEAGASELAKRLLLEFLDEKNRKNFAEQKPLEVESGIHSGIKYQIPHYDGRIKAWKGDKVISELCLQVRAPEWIPHEDKLLAKLLYLRCDEAAALRTANHFNQKENLLRGLN